MAPEQARGDRDEVDAQTDVWGLGATLYEALTGRPPFGGAEPAAPGWRVALEVMRGDVVPPRAVDATVPEALDAVCRAALAREKAGRHESAGALAAELRAWLAGAPLPAGRRRRLAGPPLGRALRGAIGRNRAVAATIAITLLLSIAKTV